jgi:hypothetical protein
LLAKTYNQNLVTKTELSKYAVDFFKASPFETDRRISEQISIGNLIAMPDGTYELSNRGRITVKVFRFLAIFFNLNKKYSNGA